MSEHKLLEDLLYANQEILHELRENNEELRAIREELAAKQQEPSPAPRKQRHHHHHHLHHPTQIHSHFEGVPMPVTLTVGQTVVETLTESNAAGNVPVIGADITVISSDSAVASVTYNGDGTATWTAVAPGTATSEYSDTVFGLSGTDTITVIAPVPVPTEIASSFGTPA